MPSPVADWLARRIAPPARRQLAPAGDADWPALATTMTTRCAPLRTRPQLATREALRASGGRIYTRGVFAWRFKSTRDARVQTRLGRQI